MRKFKITSKAVALLFDTLRECQSKIKTIDLDENSLGDAFMDSFVEYIASAKSLREISLNKNNITDKGIKMLSDCVANDNSDLEMIFLKGNTKITDASIPQLTAMIRKSSIHDIQLSGTSITNQNDIAVALFRNQVKKGYKIMSFAKRQVNDDGIKTICEMIKNAKGNDKKIVETLE